MPLRVLCINAYPIASKCPIGYMSEHLFNKGSYEILEYHTVPCEVYKNLSARHRVNLNKVVVAEVMDTVSTTAASETTHTQSPLISFFKETVKFFSPMFFSKKIKKQVREFSPQVIYTQGYDIRILQFCKKLSKKYGIPVVVHTLDYWFSDKKYMRSFQMKRLKQCLSAGKTHLAGSPKMQSFLEEKFCVKSLFVTNCSSFEEISCEKLDRTKEFFTIGYIGNLTPGRHNVLNTLSETIEESDLKGKLKLSVYAPDDQILRYQLNGEIDVHKAVSQDHVAAVYQSFDFLLHVESFEQKDIFFTKYSLSTKIAECLVTGKPLVYFGPQNIGVGDFIKKEDIGVFSEDANELLEKVYFLISSAMRYQEVCQRQYECALRFFEKSCVQDKFENLLAQNADQSPKIVHYISFFLDEKEAPDRKKEIAAQAKIRYIGDVILKSGRKLRMVSTALADRSIRSIFLPRKVVNLSEHEEHIYLSNVHPKTKFAGLYMMFSLTKYLLFSVKKGDCILVYHSPSYFLPLRVFKLFKRNRLFLEFNDLYSLHYTDQKKSQAVHKKEKRVLKFPDAFILASPFMREIIDNRKSIINYGSYAVINNAGTGINDNKSHLVIYTGVVEALRKGAFVVAESAKYLPHNIHIHIAGYGSAENISSLRELCNSVNEETGRTAVEYIGCLNYDELSELMQKACLAINAHTYAKNEIWKSKYSFPSKIPLNMANGLFVVTYPYDIITTSPMKDACVFFEELTGESMAKAIVKGVEMTQNSSLDPKTIIKKMDDEFTDQIANLLNGQ